MTTCSPPHVSAMWLRSLTFSPRCPPSLPTRSSLLHTLLFVRFSSLSLPLSPARSLALFSSGCYISIMQPLPASEGERIRPTLPSVVACQPRLYILSRLTEMAATLFFLLTYGNAVDRIIINGKPGGTHGELATS